MKHFLYILFILFFTSVEAQHKKNSIKAPKLKSTKTKYNFSANVLAMPKFNKPNIGAIEIGFNVPILKDALKKRLTVGSDFDYTFDKKTSYLAPNISYTMPISSRFFIIYKAGVISTIFPNNIKSTEKKSKYSYNPDFISTIGVEPNVKVFQNKNYNVNVFMRYEFASQNTLSAFGQLMHVGVNVQNSDAKTAK